MSYEYTVTVPTRRYEQRLRAQTAEETRRRVLDALYDQLRATPAQPVSVDRIARTADVARSTVYVIFGSRAGLFDAFAADLLESGGFQRVLDAVADPDPRVTLRDEAGASARYPCVLLGERVVVLPAFSSWAGGTAAARLLDALPGGAWRALPINEGAIADVGVVVGRAADQRDSPRD